MDVTKQDAIRKPVHVTVTGLDDRTDLGRLAELSARFAVEWGVLMSPGAQGVLNRFPSNAVIERALGLGVVLSAHICGASARSIMKGTFDRSSLPLDGFARIQVNHVRPDAERIAAIAGPGQSMIGQWRDGATFPDGEQPISWLYDPSGGRGLAPVEWPINPTDALVGYAGGITPGTIATVAAAVSARTASAFWLDFENGARTDDWFDLDLVEMALSAVL